ncbi:MAG: GAF domain-containing protein [Lachnospiraceae bacterium]
MEYKKERTMTDYTLLRDQLLALAEDVEYEITNLSNASALLYHSLEGLNWAGFYLWRDGSLILGPFQGKPACTRILPGRGVCGTAAEKDQTVRVEDVHQFPGHIACDCASNSEIVIPLHRNGELYGVLDMDSPRLGRFTKEGPEGAGAVLPGHGGDPGAEPGLERRKGTYL